MTGASIEATLELWASSLREVKRRIRPLFTQERVAASAGLFLDGLLGEEERQSARLRRGCSVCRSPNIHVDDELCAECAEKVPEYSTGREA